MVPLRRFNSAIPSAIAGREANSILVDVLGRVVEAPLFPIEACYAGAKPRSGSAIRVGGQSGQCTSWRSPSMVSTMAVQLSTQSPQLR